MKKTGILKALVNLSKQTDLIFPVITKAGTRINQEGDSLEFYIKDLFANTVDIPKAEKKDEVYQDYFSWLGNQNNPPDFIVSEGDAVEVKKLSGYSGHIALNSSFPKNYLHADDKRITSDCRNCEEWDKKDIIYTVGVTSESTIEKLWFVYGDCYAANREVYLRITNTINSGINDINGVEFSKTNELGRVNKVDPLGITSLRIRGMWQIDAPYKVFSPLLSEEEMDINNIFLVISKQKYKQEKSKLDSAEYEQLDKSYRIVEKQIKDPNNPAKNKEIILLYGKK